MLNSFFDLLKQHQLLNRYLKTEGKVLNSYYDTSSDYKGNKYYYPRVEYQYKVGNKIYTSKKLRKNWKRFNSSESYCFFEAYTTFLITRNLCV